ncbi:MAG TPA: glycine cleavage system protein GcvH [Anaerolineaceae bacterium]|nr:glycine cleavage system protein GcvH [Anaerolineaceae bacterium]HQP08819.1 glycine cleavage system protein GcvH [Anaerolineaceae bacterium]
MNIPTDLKYTESDEWLKLEGSTAIIGITDYAQEHLSDVVYVEFPVAEGDEVVKGDAITTIESVKAAAEVNSPVSGTVTAVNEEVTKDTGSVNTDPFGTAWMVKVKVSDPSEIDAMMDAAAYEKYCAGRS